LIGVRAHRARAGGGSSINMHTSYTTGRPMSRDSSRIQEEFMSYASCIHLGSMDGYEMDATWIQPCVPHGSNLAIGGARPRPDRVGTCHDLLRSRAFPRLPRYPRGDYAWA
jgi:hypothetical protein